MVAAAIGLSAGAGLLGSLVSGSAAQSAASTQASAADQASANTLAQFEQTNANLAPFRTTGSNAFQQLGAIYGLNAPSGSATATPATPSAPAASGFNSASSGGSSPAGGQYGNLSLMSLPDGGNGLVDSNGNFVATFDASNNAVTGPFATLNAAQAAGYGLPAGSSGQQASAPSTGSAAAPTANPLASYGLSGVTYNPADYGLGNGTFNPASFGLGNGTFQPTEAQLEATPGYQFDLSQGLKSVQNNATAMGQGVSGAAQKAAAQYATGLADNTLSTQANIFNSNLTNAKGIYGTNLANTQGIFQQNLSNVINPLLSYSQLGENAAAQTGTIGANAISAQSNLLTGAANAQAAGTVGSANAISSGLSSTSQAPLNYLLYNNLLGNTGFTDNTSTF